MDLAGYYDQNLLGLWFKKKMMAAKGTVAVVKFCSVVRYLEPGLHVMRTPFSHLSAKEQKSWNQFSE